MLSVKFFLQLLFSEVSQVLEKWDSNPRQTMLHLCETSCMVDGRMEFKSTVLTNKLSLIKIFQPFLNLTLSCVIIMQLIIRVIHVFIRLGILKEGSYLEMQFSKTKRPLG